jgi:hypothetical protein
VPLPATVLVVSSSLHGTDQNEEAENGCYLGESFNHRRYAVVEGTTDKD